MNRPLTPILDEHASQVMLRLWMPVDTVCDTPHRQLSVSSEGLIIGHNEIVVPESDAERWSAFDGVIARRIDVPDDELVVGAKVSQRGEIVGDPDPAAAAETEAERSWVANGSPSSSTTVREDWV